MLQHRTDYLLSTLANAAIAITAVAVYVMGWGRYADATIVTTILMFLTFSALNHATIASMERNLKPVNLLRPFMTLLLVGFLLPGHDRGASPVTQQPWSARKASRIINHRGRILGQ